MIALAALCICLVVALVVTKKTATQEKRRDTEKILIISNDLMKTSSALNAQRQVKTTLEKELEARKQQLGELTNKYTEVATKFTQTTATLAQTEQ